jgi:hypothetical protein
LEQTREPNSGKLKYMKKKKKRIGHECVKRIQFGQDGVQWAGEEEGIEDDNETLGPL